MRCSSSLKQFGAFFAIVCMYWFVTGCGEGVPHYASSESKADVRLGDAGRAEGTPQRYQRAERRSRRGKGRPYCGDEINFWPHGCTGRDRCSAGAEDNR